jgi:hypothetical protein
MRIHTQSTSAIDARSLYSSRLEGDYPGSECPSGDGAAMPILAVSDDLTQRILARMSLGHGFLVGSGGAADYLLERWPGITSQHSWEALFVQLAEGAPAEKRSEPGRLLSAADLVAEVKATLGVNVTELAAMARVSRQTLYGWLDDGAISKDNYDRLFALRQVCGQWRALAEKPVGRLIHGKSENGVSLFELLERDVLDEGAVRAQLDVLAARLARQSAERARRHERLQPLDEKSHRENLLIHVSQVTDA